MLDHPKRRQLLLALLLVGIGAGGLYWGVRRTRLAALQDQAASMAIALQAELQRLEGLLQANVDWVQAGHDLQAGPFEGFNAKLLKDDPVVLQMQWLDWVSREQRSAYEQQLSAGSAFPVQLREPDRKGEMTQAPEAQDYLVLRLGSRSERLKLSLGLNVMFNAERRERYHRAAREGRTLASGIVPLFLASQAEGSGEFLPGLAISRPVGPPPSAGDARVRGFVSMLVDPEALLARSVDPMLPQRVTLRIADLSEGGILLTERHASSLRRVFESNPSRRVEAAPAQRELVFFDRRWALGLTPDS